MQPHPKRSSENRNSKILREGTIRKYLFFRFQNNNKNCKDDGGEKRKR